MYACSMYVCMYACMYGMAACMEVCICRYVYISIYKALYFLKIEDPPIASGRTCILMYKMCCYMCFRFSSSSKKSILH